MSSIEIELRGEVPSFSLSSHDGPSTVEEAMSRQAWVWSDPFLDTEH